MIQASYAIVPDFFNSLLVRPIPFARRRGFLDAMLAELDRSRSQESSLQPVADLPDDAGACSFYRVHVKGR